ncbi:MAG: LL-diaminopimelate aminotransferase [Candidatus Altiarchaeota archaeon]|nr:LL-diaminopimelate aminotransferase [Candidatus Altiarchaeota archaeon]
MEYSDRVKRIPPYLFAEIDRAIEKKKAAGMDVISLGIGDPDIPTPKNVIERLCRAANDPANHKYPSYAGMPSFRKAAADWYKKRFGVPLDPASEALTLIGSKEGIAHIPLAFVDPGDVVLFSDPGYPVYRVGTILAGGRPVEVPLLEENGFLPDYSSIDRDDAKAAKILFINYPNNPTASVADREFFKATIDFAVENDILVCHDAPYSEIAFDGYKAPSILEVPGAKEYCVEFHSLSKTYNMTGWRIGFAVGNREAIAGLGKIKENVDSGAFQAVQEAGIEALSGPQDSVKKNVEVFRERRDLMVDGLRDIGFSVEKPKATFYLWFRIPWKYDSSVRFAGDVLEKTGVVITPGTGFGRYGEGFVRCALTQSKERLEEALERLRKLK